MRRQGIYLSAYFFALNFAANNCNMEKIVVNPKSRRELVEKYGSYNVSKALSFKSNSQMSKEIRHEAMNVYKGTIFKF
jgi:hypothetical protein